MQLVFLSIRNLRLVGPTSIGVDRKLLSRSLIQHRHVLNVLNGLNVRTLARHAPCTGYSNKSLPSLCYMEDIAWILRSDPKRKQIGFVRSRRLAFEERHRLTDDDSAVGRYNATGTEINFSVPSASSLLTPVTSVAIVCGLVRSLDRYADVVRLLFRQLRELHAKLA